jgi:UDP-N-acetylglucosamine 4,6-dehydratase
MQKVFSSPKLRYFIGDVRDEARMESACRGVDIVVHAAAMKQVPACEYNPYEAVKTNIIGTHNVISACVKNGVKKAVFITSDKAVDPVNLYGATKMVAEKLWLDSNKMSKTMFSVGRWGNVMGSRGSVIPLFEKQTSEGKTITITDERMTRFWMTIEDATKFIWGCIGKMKGGETFVPDLKSCLITDLAKVINPHWKFKVIGIRNGEKLHETLGEGYVSNDPKRLLTLSQVKKLYAKYKSTSNN